MRLYYPEEKIRSAGVYPHSGRRPTPHAEEVAEEEFGIDLRDHRSTALADEHIEWADLIVVMDDRNYSNVKEKISEGKFLLFLDDKVVEDPFKKGKDAYSLVYNQIANAIKRWVNAG
jgi:protein-tyrosine phosphatase